METLEIPVKIDARFGGNQADDMSVEDRMRIWWAISLYLDRKISIGKAAQLAGMDNGEFQDYISHHGIPVSLLTFGELEEELEMLRKTGRIK